MLLFILHYALELKWSSKPVILVFIYFAIVVVADILGIFLNKYLPAADGIRANPLDSFARYREKLGGSYAPIIFIFVGTFLSASLGISVASRQKVFPVLSTHPDAAFVSMADGKAICAVYDPDTKRCTGEFIVVELSDKDGVRFQNKEIGPLLAPR